MIDPEPRTGRFEVSHTLTDAMEAAGVHPAYVHAVRTCGFVHTEENERRLTPDQLHRWEAALDDWFAHHPDGPA